MATGDAERRWRMRLQRSVFDESGGHRSGRWSPKLMRIQWVVPVLLIGVAVFGYTVFVLLANVSDFELSWHHPWSGEVPAGDRGDLVRDTLGILALFGAALAAVYAYRKQRLEEASGHRADAEGLSQRYQDAANQLGHDRAPIRLAGVYAMARLADDWQEQRQTCVDVLCAYLRMPRIMDSAGQEDRSDHQVRRTIIDSINQRLVPTIASHQSWSSLDFDFSEATLSDFRMTNAVFLGKADFSHVTFVSGCRFEHCSILGEGTFDYMRVKGYLSIHGMTPAPSRQLSFESTYIAEGSTLYFATVPTEHQDRAFVAFNDMNVRGRFALRLPLSGVRDAMIDVNNLKLNGGTVEVSSELRSWSDKQGLSHPTVFALGWEINGETCVVDISRRAQEDELVVGSKWEGDVPDEFHEFRTFRNPDGSEFETR